MSAPSYARDAAALELAAASEKITAKIDEAKHLAEGLRAHPRRLDVALPELDHAADLLDELAELLRFVAAIRKGAETP